MIAKPRPTREDVPRHMGGKQNAPVIQFPGDLWFSDWHDGRIIGLKTADKGGSCKAGGASELIRARG
jgi:hypothetical protein